MSTPFQKLIRAFMVFAASTALCFFAVFVTNSDWRRILPPLAARGLSLAVSEVELDQTIQAEIQKRMQLGQPYDDLRREARQRLESDTEKHWQDFLESHVTKSADWRSQILTALAVVAVAIWISAVLLDGFFSISLLTTGLFAGWIALRFVGTSNFALPSIAVVLVLTLTGACFIARDCRKRELEEWTASSQQDWVANGRKWQGREQEWLKVWSEIKEQTKTNRALLFSGSLFLSSGFFTLAGWFPPLPFAQPLGDVPIFRWVIDLRIACTALFASAFVVTGITNAVVQVWSDQAAYLRIKAPVLLALKNPQVSLAAKHILAPLILVFHSIRQMQRWVWEVLKHLFKMLWQLIRHNLYKSALMLFRYVAASWLISVACQWFGIHLHQYLRDESISWMSSSALTSIGWLVLEVLGIALGLHLLTFERHADFTERDVAGKVLPVLFAAWVTGIALWLIHFTRVDLGIVGFQSVGIFAIALPVVLMLAALVTVLHRFFSNAKELSE